MANVGMFYNRDVNFDEWREWGSLTKGRGFRMVIVTWKTCNFTVLDLILQLLKYATLL